MSRDYGELEKEFITELEARTGCDLSGWMAAIDSAAPGGKNEIIDWLRPQGFTFAHASWLERIHHNGGKPVYSEDAGDGIETRREVVPKEPKISVPPAQRPLPSILAPNIADRLPAGANENMHAAVYALLAKGKAYRPLAQMVIQEIRRQSPAAEVFARRDLIEFKNPETFATLLITAKGLKLGLALKERDEDYGLASGGMAGGDVSMTYTTSLTDARQVDNELRRLLAAADHHTNG